MESQNVEISDSVHLTALCVCSGTPAVLRGLIGDALPGTLQQDEHTCSRPSWQVLGQGTRYEKDPRQVEEHAGRMNYVLIPQTV